MYNPGQTPASPFLTHPCRSRVSLIWLLLVILLAGCGGAVESPALVRPEQPLPEQAETIQVSGDFGGKLRYPLVGEPETFNLLAAQDARSKVVAGLLTATLLEFDAVEQRVVGGVTREYHFSPDGLSLSLNLRKGVRFSDGEPLTADDVVFTFDRIYDERSNNVLKDTLLIDGEPFAVKKVGELEVEIAFPRPYAASAYILTTVPILPKHVLEDWKEPIELAWTLETPPAEMVGLGPFVVAEHVPGQRTELSFNPHYWKADQEGRRLPYLDGIVFEYLEDRNTQVLRLKSFELDLTDQLLRPEDLELFKNDEQFRAVDAGASSNLTFLWFNMNAGKNPENSEPYLSGAKRQWFLDRRFRQAISCLVSRETIVKNVYSGIASEATSFISSSNRTWYAAEMDRFEYDLDQARTLLKEAGFNWKSIEGREVLVDTQGNPVEFELLTRADEVLGKIAAIIQQDLERVGIRVSVRQEEFRAVITRVMGARNYDAALMNLDFPVEPTDISNVLTSDGAMHIWNLNPGEGKSHWEGRIDGLMNELGTTLDGGRRVELFAEVQQIMASELPIVPLVNRNVVVVANGRLQNVQIATVFPYALSGVWSVSWARN